MSALRACDVRVDSGPAPKASSQKSDSILYGLSMEGSHTKTRPKKQGPCTKRELIVALWNRLGRKAVGESELGEIQRSIGSQFGQGANESPAAIARVLADEGAELRHPEVIELDARWREAKIESDAARFKGLEDVLSGKPLRLKKAEALIKKLEKLRKNSERAGDQLTLKQVRTMLVNAREVAESLAKDRTLDPPERAEQAELAQWLKVWIQTPSLFEDWLDLRRRSPDFRKKFDSEFRL
jgi:hypothetical protein